MWLSNALPDARNRNAEREAVRTTEKIDVERESTTRSVAGSSCRCTSSAVATNQWLATWSGRDVQVELEELPSLIAELLSLQKLDSQGGAQRDARGQRVQNDAQSAIVQTKRFDTRAFALDVIHRTTTPRARGHT